MNRQPVIAIAVSAALIASAASGALFVGATSAAAEAPGGPTVSAENAPAGRVMGQEVLGLDGKARVHAVRTDEHGRAASYMIERTSWFGFKSEYVSMEAEELGYQPDRNVLIVPAPGERLQATADTAPIDG